MKTPPIQLLVPMSGQGTRYRQAGYTEPKPLIPVNGVPMIERLLSTFPPHWPAHFVLAENHRRTALPNVLKKLRPQSRISYVPVHAQGPAIAIQEGLKRIPAGAPVFVSYCDYGQVWDAHQFERFVRDSACDACLVSYRGFHPHYLSPVTYAYSWLEEGNVTKVKEKGSFTDNRENEFASSGGYYFRSAALLKKAIAYQIKNDLKVNGEFYTSLTVQALIESRVRPRVRVFEIPAFFQWGTPEELRRYEYWERTFLARQGDSREKRGAVRQLLMPMAGKGSRFESFTSLSKPFIPLAGEPMFLRALGTLPAAVKTVVVALKSMEPSLRYPALKTVLLEDTPAGQALSTDAGLRDINLDEEVMVSACDHGVVMGSAWKRFHRDPQCDAAIFTIRGFPGTQRKPHAFAYVDTGRSSGAFPLVANVSVKKPLSENPERDRLLVGTFWFRQGRLLKEAIADIVRDDVRVNGELYLDSAFNAMIKRGLRVRAVPLAGYINWGDPDSLAEALYWEDVFSGQRLAIRPRFPGVKF